MLGPGFAVDFYIFDINVVKNTCTYFLNLHLFNDLVHGIKLETQKVESANCKALDKV